MCVCILYINILLLPLRRGLGQAVSWQLHLEVIPSEVFPWSKWDTHWFSMGKWWFSMGKWWLSITQQYRDNGAFNPTNFECPSDSADKYRLVQMMALKLEKTAGKQVNVLGTWLHWCQSLVIGEDLVAGDITIWGNPPINPGLPLIMLCSICCFIWFYYGK